jgi:hypothetical protein
MSSGQQPQRRRHDATGRTKKKDEPHFRLYAWFAKLPAWKDLTPAERCVYIEIELRFNGANNGQISLSGREAAAGCRISKDTAYKAFDSLIEHGFICCRTPGGFNRNSCLATEWWLTRAPCDVTRERASYAFKTWELPSEEVDRRAAVAAARAARTPEHRPKRGTVPSETRDSTRRKTA